MNKYLFISFSSFIILNKVHNMFHKSHIDLKLDKNHDKSYNINLINLELNSPFYSINKNRQKLWNKLGLNKDNWDLIIKSKFTFSDLFEYKWNQINDNNLYKLLDDIGFDEKIWNDFKFYPIVESVNYLENT